MKQGNLLPKDKDLSFQVKVIACVTPNGTFIDRRLLHRDNPVSEIASLANLSDRNIRLDSRAILASRR